MSRYGKEFDDKMKREHIEKYEALAQAIGVARLIEHLEHNGPGRGTVKAALAAGDEHLNTIGLHNWDRMAYWDDSPMNKSPHSLGVKCSCGVRLQKDWKYCPQCGISTAVKLSPYNRAPWDGAGRNTSCAERVCVLKHVAKFHYIGEGV